MAWHWGVQRSKPKRTGGGVVNGTTLCSSLQLPVADGSNMVLVIAKFFRLASLANSEVAPFGYNLAQGDK
jgi:hypothetical protein